MSQLPRGTVTFLFTDIENSTRLWEQHPQLMDDALAQHDRLIQECVTSEGGVVVKNTGDGFYAAFETAAQGLTATLATQQRLHEATWDPQMGPLKVRMALHTGTAEPRNNDYFGPAVNRAARLCAAGHGQQILVSAATQALLVEDLPEGVDLVDLGKHQLKGLFGRETIYQLTVPGYPNRFPPLRSLEPQGQTLPVQATAFLGRERQLVELSTLIKRGDVRLVTVTGPGGTGKTRLSLAVAESLMADFPGGVHFVELAQVTDPNQVLPAITEALSVPTNARRPAAEALAHHFADRRSLLVLDNFEQVVAAAPQLAALLARSSSLKLLVTSREILGIYGEHNYPLPPFTLPEEDENLTPAVLAQNEAIALFRLRATAVNPSFRLDEANAPAVSAICHQLDGLPLAIELAASQIGFLTPETLLRRLESKLPLVTRSRRGAPQRQQTIQDAIDWSFNLLDEQQQRLFVQLSIFIGGWTLEAAEAVCLLAEPEGVLPGMADLRDKSLLQQEVSATGETRFTMLETIRSYARAKLRESEDNDPIVGRHIAFYTAVANQDLQTLLRQYGPEAHRKLFFEDYGNILSAMKRAQATGRLSEVLEIGTGEAVIYEYLSLEARLEFVAMIVEALDGDFPIEPGLRAKALYQLASIQSILPGQLQEAAQRCEASLQLYRKYKLTDLRIVINTLGNIRTKQGRHEEALAAYQEALDLARKADDTYSVALITGNISSLLAQVGDIQQADALARLAIELCTQDEAFGEQAVFKLVRANIELIRGNPDKARQIAQAALDHLRRYRESHFLTWGLTSVGRIAIQQQQYDQARRYLLESLQVLVEYTDDESLIQTLESAAELELALERWQEAATLLGASSTLRTELGLVRLPLPQTEFEKQMAQLQEHLVQELLQSAWERGEALSWEKAIELAVTFLEAD